MWLGDNTLHGVGDNTLHGVALESSHSMVNLRKCCLRLMRCRLWLQMDRAALSGLGSACHDAYIEASASCLHILPASFH